MIKTIVLKLQGGLGNQMFQYALGRALQEQYKAKLILDTSDFRYDKVGRMYALDVFKLHDNLIVDDTGCYNWKYDQRHNYFIKAAIKMMPNFFMKLASAHGKYIWENIEYKPLDINTKSEIIYVHGLWQSEKYFKPIEKQLCKEFHIKQDNVVSCMHLAESIQKENSVAVHLRRSDYLNKNNKNHVLGLSYYYKAMDYLDQVFEHNIYYIFSDDIVWAKNNLKTYKRNVCFIEDNFKDYEEFYLMYNCKHYVLANSTFSWWGSFVGKKDDSLILAPSKWYDDNTDISSLLRSEFIIIDE